MSDAYSYADVARIFDLQEARLRYWAQTGVISPSEKRRGRRFFTFRDLIAVRVAKDLLDSGMSLQRVRKNLDGLRALLPDAEQPLASRRVVSDGDRIVVIDEDGSPFSPESGQVLMDFAVSSLTRRVADVLALRPRADEPPVASLVSEDAAPPSGSAYSAFIAGCRAQDDGDPDSAASLFARAVQLDPSLAAAHTNLGNLRFAAGDLTAARAHYETALELEPDQPEARFNLGNVLSDLGETDLAIAELRQVCTRCPDFADAHFNLGLALAEVGGTAQARACLERYLVLDPDSPWSTRARDCLAQL